MNYIKNWDVLVAHVLAEYPNEACGIINTKNMFIPCKNIAEDPLHTFQIESKVWAKNKVKAVIHSHPYATSKEHEVDPRSPSKADMQGQIDTDVEWGIVVTEGENVTDPVWWGNRDHRPKLMEREFIFNIQDCLAFAADWLHIEHNINLPYMPRDVWWTDTDEDYISQNFALWGFVDVTNEERRRGDVALYTIKAKVINHISIFTDNNNIVHHQFNRMPKAESFAVWNKYCNKIIRHRSMI